MKNRKYKIPFESIDIEFNDGKPLNWNGRHDLFKKAFVDFLAERIDSGKKASYSNGDEYIDWMESALKFIVDALVKHAIEFGDEYILNCYGLVPVDATKINKLVAQRDKHTLEFLGLENSSNEELKNWNANNLEKLPLVKDFEKDFTPINPLLDRVWVIYHPAADRL